MRPGPTVDQVQSQTELASGTSNGLAWALDVQERALDRISDWIRAADAKTTPILAIDAALTATLVGLAARPGAWMEWSGYWLFLGAALLVTSLLMVAISTSPRLTRRAPSLIFFGEIASLPPGEYLARVSARSPVDYLADLTTQCHRNAEIATAKYRWVRFATLALLLGLLPWLIALYVLVGA
jgi:uncharacterized membrane protein YgdD (TMEM256/DUF423 family)